MRIHKTIYLELWVAKKLDEHENQSQLINALLKNHFLELEKLEELKKEKKEVEENVI